MSRMSKAEFEEFGPLGAVRATQVSRPLSTSAAVTRAVSPVSDSMTARETGAANPALAQALVSPSAPLARPIMSLPSLPTSAEADEVIRIMRAGGRDITPRQHIIIDALEHEMNPSPEQRRIMSALNIHAVVARSGGTALSPSTTPATTVSAAAPSTPTGAIDQANAQLATALRPASAAIDAIPAPPYYPAFSRDMKVKPINALLNLFDPMKELVVDVVTEANRISGQATRTLTTPAGPKVVNMAVALPPGINPNTPLGETLIRLIAVNNFMILSFKDPANLAKAIVTVLMRYVQNGKMTVEQEFKLAAALTQRAVAAPNDVLLKKIKDELTPKLPGAAALSQLTAAARAAAESAAAEFHRVADQASHAGGVAAQGVEGALHRAWQTAHNTWANLPALVKSHTPEPHEPTFLSGLGAVGPADLQTLVHAANAAQVHAADAMNAHAVASQAAAKVNAAHVLASGGEGAIPARVQARAVPAIPPIPQSVRPSVFSGHQGVPPSPAQVAAGFRQATGMAPPAPLMALLNVPSPIAAHVGMIAAATHDTQQGATVAVKAANAAQALVAQAQSRPSSVTPAQVAQVVALARAAQAGSVAAAQAANKSTVVAEDAAGKLPRESHYADQWLEAYGTTGPIMGLGEVATAAVGTAATAEGAATVASVPAGAAASAAVAPAATPGIADVITKILNMITQNPALLTQGLNLTQSLVSVGTGGGALPGLPLPGGGPGGPRAPKKKGLPLLPIALGAGALIALPVAGPIAALALGAGAAASAIAGKKKEAAPPAGGLPLPGAPAR